MVDRIIDGVSTSIRIKLVLFLWNFFKPEFINSIVLIYSYIRKQKCLDEEKEEKDLEREAPSVTEKSYVITSKVSPNQLSVVSLVVVVSNVSLV